MINLKKFYFLCISVIYILLLLFLSDADMYFANIIMTLSLIIGLFFVYDTSQSIFCVRNIFHFVFIVVGFHIRYFLILISKDTFMSFAPRPLQDLPSYHIKTAVVLLVVTIVLGIAYNTKLTRTYKGRVFEKLIPQVDVFQYMYIKIFFWILLVTVMAYKCLNTTVAISSEFRVFDNLFNSLMMIVQLLAYSALAYYISTHRKKYLIYYFVYFIPTIMISLINMWKSGLLFEVIILCIAFHKNLKNVKKRYIILCVVSAITIFPVISMLRDNARYNTGYQIKLESIIDYNIENNVIKSYSERLQYYDETYYCLNTSPKDIREYQNATGGIVSRFFAGLIPRVIWKNKPVINSGQYITYVLLHYPQDIYNNLTVGLISDCYISYSYLGVIIIMFFFGKAIKTLEQFRLKNEGMYMQGGYLTMSRIVFSFMEGDIASKSLSVVIFLIVIFCLKLLLITKYKRGYE